MDKGVKDNADIFRLVTLKGDAKMPKLSKMLCGDSAAEVDWVVTNLTETSLCWQGSVATRSPGGQVSFSSGSSTKTTSGIIGAGTKTQERKGVLDSAENFTAVQTP